MSDVYADIPGGWTMKQKIREQVHTLYCYIFKPQATDNFYDFFAMGVNYTYIRIH